MEINVKFKNQTYVAQMTIADFEHKKKYFPSRLVSVKGFGGIEMKIPIGFLVFESENNSGSSAYCQRGFLEEDTK